MCCDAATYAGGVLLASALAGAIVVLPISLFAILAEQRDPAGMLGGLPFVWLLATAMGFMVSFLPNLGGTALLAWLGTHHRTARNPLVWAALGFAIAWLMSALFTASFDPTNGALGVVGSCCALICRWRTRWEE